MRNLIRARGDAHDRRQRLQIGGGIVIVAVIWTVALWPSGGEEPTSHSSPVPRTSHTAWTRPFAGTAPTSQATSVPTVLESTVPTVRRTETAVDSQPRDPVSTSAPTAAVAPTSTSAPTPTTKSPPTKKGNGNGKPPKPPNSPSPTTSEGTDLLDIFGL